MNTVTIKNILHDVVDKWVNTFLTDYSATDEPRNVEHFILYFRHLLNEFKNKLKSNIIISGGALTSLFLNEEVNDYDIYFTDDTVINNIRNFYLEIYNRKQLTEDEQDWKWSDKFNCLYRLKHKNYELLDEAELYNNWEKYTEITDALSSKFITEKEGEYIPICITPNAISLTNKIQLITRFTGTPEKILSNFDFVHTNNYYKFDTNELVTNKKSLESILTKQLIYNGSKYPICSLIRTRKFIQRGWNISAAEYLKMAFQIKELDLYNLNILREQLIGVDAKYFIKFLEELKKYNSFEEIDIFKLLDEIFEEVGE
jgi:hypothetical protein